jgi:hypothetical protein
MATLGTNAVTYLDIAARSDMDGKISAIIELLGKTNEVLTDMMTVEGNLPTGHKTTIRTGLPTATWRKLNYGVLPTKSQTSQVTDTCGMLEAYAEVDKALADLNGNTAAFRLSEDAAHLEAMNQQMATAIFYATQATNPEQFTGLMPRYPQYGAEDPTVTAYNCIDTHAAATGAVQTSIWLIVWGENTVHGIYPKGSQSGGFTHTDLKEVTLYDSQSSPGPGRYQGYRTHYKWDLGLTVRDWRYAVRCANVDTALLSTTAVDLFFAMTKAYYRIPSFGMGRAAFYCNRLIAEYLQQQAAVKANLALRYEEVGGKPVTRFMGIPIRRCDALLNTEAEVLTI